MAFPALSLLIQEVYSLEKNQEKLNEENNMKEDNYVYNPVYERYKILNQLLRQKGYWPSIQVKWFYDRSGLVMLYNAHKNYEYNKIIETPLYKECRSIILNITADQPENTIVSSISNDIPLRVSDRMYKEICQNTDVLETGYEGTMINVYHHGDKWQFSTATCPSIDCSKYFHPTKTHGAMLNEYLMKIFPDCCSKEEYDISSINMNGMNIGIAGGAGTEEPGMDIEMEPEMVINVTETELSKMLRTRFVEHLDKSKTYLFVLIHHENKHLIDYSSHFGKEYKELLHISTQSKGVEEPILNEPYSYMGVKYPVRFDGIESALAWLNGDLTSYAIIVKRKDGTILKVCRENIVFQEETNLGNANPWHNMLWIFLKNRPDFTVADYARSKPHLPIRTETGKILSPTFVIHNTISSITTNLYNLYFASTYYNLTTKELIFKGKLDKTYAPIIRFHMVQLRNIQKNMQPNKLMTLKMIADYLRYHQTMKNIRMLIAHYANNPIDNISKETQFCIKKLNDMLFDK